MPTPAELKTEIESGPLAAELAKAWAEGRTGDVAAALNHKRFRGYVPIAEVASYCCVTGITGGVMAFLEIQVGATDNPPVTLTVQTKALLHTVLTLIQLDYRLNYCDTDDPAFGAACDGLIALGIMSSAQKAALTDLGENRRSRAEVLWGYGASVSLADASEARKVA